ncbi:MAG: RHS repeat protein, partial [Verrucomicrobiales bacterium]|nr:RHS repeat protein [Verrucomicrobiales bacterium]
GLRTLDDRIITNREIVDEVLIETDAAGIMEARPYTDDGGFSGTFRPAVVATLDDPDATEVTISELTTIDRTYVLDGGELGYVETTIDGEGYRRNDITIRDALGRVKEMRAFGQRPLMNKGYDTANRVENTFTHNYLGTITTTRYRDGLVKSETGDGAVNRFYEREIQSDGTVLETTYVGAEDSPMKIEVIRSIDGRTLSVTKPDPANPSQTVVTRYFHDAVGRIVRVETPGRADAMTDYDSVTGDLGVQGTDLDEDGNLAPLSQDPRAESSVFYEKDANDVWWQVQRRKSFVDDQGDSTAVVEESRRTLDTIDPVTWVTQADGSRYRVTQSTNATAHYVKQVIEQLDATDSVLSQRTRWSVAGRSAAETHTTGVGIVHYTVNAWCDLVEVEDPHAGVTRWEYDDSGRMWRTSLPDGRSLTYDFFAVSTLVEQVEERAADAAVPTRVTRYGYDAMGNRTDESSPYSTTDRDRGYRIRKTFNTMGQLASLKTYRASATLAGNTWSDDFDETTWTYDSATGLLTSKQDARGRETTYTYDSAGRVATRTWQRGAVTSYDYDGLGRLETMSYSGDGGVTPGVSYSYDRLGRVISTTDGTGERTTSYSLGETNPSEVLWSNDASTLHQGLSLTYDTSTPGRAGGWTLSQGSTDLAEVSYGYNAPSGTLQSVSLGGRSATYDWSQVVTGLPGSVSYSGSGIVGTRTPDPLGRLGSISWKGSAAGPIVSSHSYTHNDWGSRATAEKEDGGTWHYGYNARQEVTSAVKKDAADIALPGRSTEYAYDEIGNRLSHQERLLDGTWAET